MSGRKLLKPGLGKQMNKYNDISEVQISPTADEALVQIVVGAQAIVSPVGWFTLARRPIAS